MVGCACSFASEERIMRLWKRIWSIGEVLQLLKCVDTQLQYQGFVFSRRSNGFVLIMCHSTKISLL
jgi:hypothetical protein